MQTDRPRKLVSLALGSTALFDITGAVIYRIVRSGLPPPGAPPASPFKQATAALLEARHEAITQTRAKQGVSLRR
jgi:hypothetical protein